MFSDPFLAQRAMAIASPSAGCQAIRATRDPDSEIVPDTFFALRPLLSPLTQDQQAALRRIGTSEPGVAPFLPASPSTSRKGQSHFAIQTQINSTPFFQSFFSKQRKMYLTPFFPTSSLTRRTNS